MLAEAVDELLAMILICASRREQLAAFLRAESFQQCGH
jgi:hypothetical protein